jgi:hypothetical protein
MKFPLPCPLIPQAHDADADAVEEADTKDKYRYDDHATSQFNHDALPYQCKGSL